MNYSNFDDLNGTANVTSSSCQNGSCIYLEKSFNPIVTDIAFILLILYILGLAILKILAGSKESNLTVNKYDLILFKSQQNYPKNQTVVGRQLFDNSKVIQHNLNALRESGFDENSVDRKSWKKRNGKIK